MNTSFLIKGLACLIGAVIFFKYFNKPLSNKEKIEKGKQEGLSEETLESLNFINKTRDLKGKIAGFGLIFIGILFIYYAFNDN